MANYTLIHAKGDATMSVEQNKAIARRWAEEIWGKGDVTVIDEIVSPALVVNGSPRTLEELKQGIRTLHATTSNLRVTVEEQIAEGDKVVNRYLGQGTYLGGDSALPEAAIGKHATIAGIDIFRIVNGKIIEQWNLADELGWLQQLGAIPTPGPGA
jgi:predicted ester cyclase